MRKALSFVLCLALLLAAMSVGAAAYSAVRSPQKLMVNGQYYECEKYNIDGSNYFKLRDLAYLLKDTAAVFGVDYSEAENSVIVVPGMPYDPVGGELTVGEDKSATAVPSAQHIWIMGTDSDGLSIYNIGGNNYFKLRDMGAALGFLVDYDAESNTAIVVTSDYTESPLGDVDRAVAFDRLRSWVADHYTFADGEDLYYLMDYVEWDDGDTTEYWVANVSLDGAPALMLRSFYFFPDGSAGETRLYMTRDRQSSPAQYLYYFDYLKDADFCGELTLDPAAFAAGVDVRFDTAAPDLGAENVAVAQHNISLALSELAGRLDELCRSEPALSPLVSIYDFGFTQSALPGEVPDIPQ